jgi:FkbM family methyltransferase
MRSYVAKVESHSFFPAPLVSGSTVVDLGVNRGVFSRWISANTDARVVGVEPVPSLFEAMPALPRTTVLQVAISASSGWVELVLNEESCAALESTGLGEAQAQRVTVRAITLEELLAQQDIEIVDLLKVDIEGAELDMFGCAPAEVLRRCRQITCEFHNFLDPTLTPKVRAVQRRLEMLGFTKMTFSLDDTDTLFLRRDQLRLSSMDLLAATAAYKYGRGAVRRLRRLLGKKE